MESFQQMLNRKNREKWHAGKRNYIPYSKSCFNDTMMLEIYIAEIKLLGTNMTEKYARAAHHWNWYSIIQFTIVL